MGLVISIPAWRWESAAIALFGCLLNENRGEEAGKRGKMAQIVGKFSGLSVLNPYSWVRE